MSNLSELLPSGGGQNVGSFVASGTIANGAVVGLKSDGKVSVVDPSSVGNTADFPTSFTVSFAAACYDAGRDVVHVAYKDNSTQSITYTGGSISGSTITWGTKIVVDTVVANPKRIDIAMNESIGLPIIGFALSSGGDLYVKSASSGSGTTMVWNGNRLLVQSGDNNDLLIAYNPNNSDASSAESLLTYVYQGDGTCYTKALSTNSSGTTSVRLSNYVAYFAGDQNIPAGLVKIGSSGNNFIVVINRVNYGNNNQGCTAYEVSIGASAITYSSPATIGTAYGASGTFCDQSLTSNTKRMASDGSSKGVITGSFKEGNSGAQTLRAYVITANGTGVVPSVANAVDMIPGVSGNLFFGANTVYDSSRNIFVTAVGYGNNAYYATVFNSTLSGTTFTVGPGSTSLQSQNIYYDAIVTAYSEHSNNVLIASNQNPVAAYRGVMYTPGSLEVNSFIGLAGQAISDTATGNIDMLGGINSQQTSLVIGSKYYVQDNGTLGTTVTSTFAGQAISATTLNIRDLT